MCCRRFNRFITKSLPTIRQPPSWEKSEACDDPASANWQERSWGRHSPRPHQHDGLTKCNRDPASLSRSNRRCASSQRASPFHQLSHSIYHHSHHPRSTGTGRRSTPSLCRSFLLKIATQMGVVYSQAIHVEGVRTTCKEAGRRRGRGGRESKGRGEGCPTASGCMDDRRVQWTGHEFPSQPHIQLSSGC